MARPAALLLTSFVLSAAIAASLGAITGAHAQSYNEARYAPERDGLDSVYDQLNAQARQSSYPTAATMQSVKNPGAYNQFFSRVQGDLNVENQNLAQQQSARQRDAMTTQAYEAKRISDLANWERSQATYTPYTRSSRSSSHYSTSAYNDIEARRQASLSQAQDAMYSSVVSNQNAAARRSMALEEDANNLRDQILTTEASNNKFGLRSRGTSLYIRQYGDPDAKLPPVHNAAARIVPMGSADD
jgi:hypothetical protein